MAAAVTTADAPAKEKKGHPQRAKTTAEKKLLQYCNIQYKKLKMMKMMMKQTLPRYCNSQG
jgi:hypothetical protein